MAGSVIVAGLGLAAVGFAGRYIIRAVPGMSHKMSETMKSLSQLDSSSFANSKYYKGGFEPKMTRREASLILGISPTASKTKVKDFVKENSVKTSDTGIDQSIRDHLLNLQPRFSKYFPEAEAHKRIMALNHPDRGGSPLLAAKINEAKDLLESGKS